MASKTSNPFPYARVPMNYGSGPRKLPFTIRSCSGEDPDYPVRQLLLHTTETRGWQTPRQGSYPQEVVLQLDKQARLQQIQLLSHEFMITQRVEIFISALPVGETDIRRAVETRLGFMSFGTNENSGYQSRELKSVALQNYPAILVRLVVHRCHVNKHNIWNQAGIVALNLIGEPDERMLPGAYGYLASAEPARDPYYHQSRLAQAQMADLALDLHVDARTAERIRELHAQKAHAVAVENYDEAKRLKGCIDRLKQLGQKIAQLEARKMAAVEREDFDEAKAIKSDIDKLRGAGETSAMGSAGSEGAARRANDPDQIFSRVLARANPHAADASPAPEGQRYAGDAQRRTTGAAPAAMPSGLPVEQFDEQPVGGATPQQSLGGEQRPQESHDGGAHSQGGHAPNSPGVGGGSQHDADSMHAHLEPAREAAPDAPQGFTTFTPDLATPPPLGAADSNDAGALVAALGEYTARCMYSRHWQHRSGALKYMADQVANGSLKDYRLLTKYLSKGLKEKVANIVLECVHTLQSALDKGGKMVTHLGQALLSDLLDKLGDGNARVVEVIREVVLSLAEHEATDVPHLTTQLLKPYKRPHIWKPLLARLLLLETLLPVLHVTPPEKDGFPLPDTVAFAASGFPNANGDVRAAALKVATLAFKEGGPTASRYLPSDTNPKVKQQIYDAVGLQAEKPAPAPAAPTPQPKAARNASARTPAKGTPARGGGGAKVAPKTGGKKAPPLVPTPVADSPGASPNGGAQSDDPEVFERELVRKEAELGPNHSEVADCLSNIAILYNQRGQQERALPMYERALAIFEATRGPDSQDVAHTLTDLAVLHLEQGRDDVGRPLLERALDIQQRKLGPDHPDVIAIQDVLHGDDD